MNTRCRTICQAAAIAAVWATCSTVAVQTGDTSALQSAIAGSIVVAWGFWMTKSKID